MRVMCKPFVEHCFSCSVLVREKSNGNMENYSVFITDKTDTHEHGFGLWTLLAISVPHKQT